MTKERAKQSVVGEELQGTEPIPLAREEGLASLPQSSSHLRAAAKKCEFNSGSQEDQISLFQIKT